MPNAYQKIYPNRFSTHTLRKVNTQVSFLGRRGSLEKKVRRTAKKNNHEIRDPIYAFIHMNSSEREVLNSAPVQRLRHIHQLALTSLVYPGATHRRFEHSLGVMELATRIYNAVLENGGIDILGIDRSNYDGMYYLRVLRMAALIHDIGHAPFSHASEDLFPGNCNHEMMTLRLIESDEMEKLWAMLKIQAEDVAKLALGRNHPKKKTFSNTEAILSEIITGDAFGADRMDYLLRDSHHTGVAYGRFDHYRLKRPFGSFLRLMKADQRNLPSV